MNNTIIVDTIQPSLYTIAGNHHNRARVKGNSLQTGTHHTIFLPPYLAGSNFIVNWLEYARQVEG